MKEINVDVVPLLPMSEIINDECVAMGIVDAGWLVHYISRDRAIIIEWSDIVDIGLKEILRVVSETAVEISGPTTPP